mgnify:CR=1 FL=1
MKTEILKQSRITSVLSLKEYDLVTVNGFTVKVPKSTYKKGHKVYYLKPYHYAIFKNQKEHPPMNGTIEVLSYNNFSFGTIIPNGIINDLEYVGLVSENERDIFTDNVEMMNQSYVNKILNKYNGLECKVRQLVNNECITIMFTKKKIFTGLLGFINIKRTVDYICNNSSFDLESIANNYNPFSDDNEVIVEMNLIIDTNGVYVLAIKENDKFINSDDYDIVANKFGLLTLNTISSNIEFNSIRKMYQLYNIKDEDGFPAYGFVIENNEHNLMDIILNPKNNLFKLDGYEQK